MESKKHQENILSIRPILSILSIRPILSILFE
jgi:hypothetical protein